MADAATPELIIRTSESAWFATLASAYKMRQRFTLIDDAEVGIDPHVQSLLDMGQLARLSVRDWAGVLVSLGMATTGVALIVAAIVDPEPTSKLGLLVGGGISCVLGGGLSAIRILTGIRPPKVRITRRFIEVDWA